MMTIFVQRASECLTDHLPHGDGLICFSILKGLANRGHRIFAYTNHNGVNSEVPGLTILEQKHRIPANGLADGEHAWRADRWLKKISEKQQVDLVWRMHPYGAACPTVPYRGTRPLVIGPLFYHWPAGLGTVAGRPRFGIGLRSVVAPLADAGWRRSLAAASLVFCATSEHVEQVKQQTTAAVKELPVIVDVPDRLVQARVPFSSNRPLRLIFVANLVAYKNPLLFCETVKNLLDRGVAVNGVVAGDGPDRNALESWCRDHEIADAIQFIGRVPNTEVFQHLADADLLLSASIGEPYGRNIVEAMSVGTPAVCHSSGGPREFITDSVDGFLIKDLHASNYANAIQKLVSAPRSLHAASDAARLKASRWTTTHVIDAVESALFKLVQESGK